MLTARQVEYSRKESLRIQGNKRKYEKEMNAVPKEIPYKNVKPSEEDLKIMNEAIGWHLLSANKKIKYNPVTKGDVMGDAYEGLIKALYSIDPEKVKNRKNYLIQKIKFHLIDCYRKRYGRKNQKISEFNTMSLNVTNERKGEELELVDLIPSVEPSSEDIYQNEEILEVIKSHFEEMDISSALSGEDIFAILMLRYEGYSLEKIAIAAGSTESRLCQIMNSHVQPLLRDIAEKLTGERPEAVNMK